MTGIPDQKAEVVLLCKVYTGLDMFLLCRHDDIFRLEAIRACGFRISGRQTGIVCIEWPQIANGIFDAVFIGICSMA